MSIKDKLEGARNGIAFFYNYLNMVGEEIGMERAIALSVKVDEMMGEAQGKMLKEHHGGNNIDINEATTMALNTIKNGFGINSEIIEKSPKKIKVRCSRCPVYEAAQSAGIDSENIEDLCRIGSVKFMDAMVKQLNPNLSYQLSKFRSGPDGFCEEEILLS